MARRLNGSSAYLSRSSTGLFASVFTLSAWVYCRDSTAVQSVVGFGNSGTDLQFVTLRVRGDLAGDPLQFSVRDDASTSADAATTDSVPLNRWVHVAGVAASATSRIPYLNGVAGSASTTSIGTITPNKISVGCLDRLSQIHFFNGDVAHVAIWGAALTAGEIAALASGTPPSLVRPASLREFWRMRGSSNLREQGAIRGLDLTANGGAWASDPFNSNENLLGGPQASAGLAPSVVASQEPPDPAPASTARPLTPGARVAF